MVVLTLIFFFKKEIGMNLSGMSVQKLRKLASKANKLADDLSSQMPSYELALENGVVDRGYNTTANGYVNNYTGKAIIRMDDGSLWMAVGRRARGDAAVISRNGFIEFLRICDGDHVVVCSPGYEWTDSRGFGFRSKSDDFHNNNTHRASDEELLMLKPEHIPELIKEGEYELPLQPGPNDTYGRKTLGFMIR